jgi:cardiolipin synthase
LSKDSKKELISSMKNILKIKPSHNYVNMQAIYNSPLFIERGISDMTIKLILEAKHDIKIITPYFLPPADVKQAIRIALKSGVSVKLMLPGKRDNKDFILTMNRDAYKELLDLGCKIYEYNGFLHSKYMVIDGRYVLTGSNNFDFRSFTINFENCLLIDDHTVAQHVNSVFEKDLLNARNFDIATISPIVNSFRHK